MKVVLIRPSSVLGDVTFFAFRYATSLARLAAYLRLHGIEVEIWDFETHPEGIKDIFLRLEKSRPRIVGLSCLTPSIKSGHEIAIYIKQKFPEVVTIVGGPHSTALPERTLEEYKAFDAVVVGEGEVTLLELCQRIKEGKSWSSVEGIAWRKNSHIIVESPRPLIQNLDCLPFPARDLLNLKVKRRAHFSRGIAGDFLRVVDVASSRGCPNRCIFCAVNLSHSQKGEIVRFRSVTNFLDEVEQCQSRYNFNHIYIDDDTFTLNRERISQISQGLKKMGLTWDCNGRVNIVIKDILKEMVDSGCQKISFGIESGSPRILELIKKNITIAQIRDAFRWSKDVGLKIREGTFIIGSHPSETKEEIEMTIDLIEELDPDFICLSIIVPYPGTEVYKLMKEKGLITRERWEDYVMYGRLPQWRTEHFSAKELMRIQRYILRRFYLNPRRNLRRLTGIRSFGELHYLTRAAFDFLKHNR